MNENRSLLHDDLSNFTEMSSQLLISGQREDDRNTAVNALLVLLTDMVALVDEQNKEIQKLKRNYRDLAFEHAKEIKKLERKYNEKNQ